MKIIGLKADGFRKLAAVEMQFSKNGLVPIVGDNEEGKTSILNFIQWMILGNKTLNPDIINWDKDKMNGELTLDNYKIERVYPKKGTPKLKVTNLATGKPETGEVQNFLNTFINELTLNPRPFLDLNTLEKVRLFYKLYKIDFTELDKRLTILEDRRLECGRKVNEYGDLDKDVPEKASRVDTTKLFADRKVIEDKNRKLSEDYAMAKQDEIEKIEVFNKEQREKQKKLSDANQALDSLKADEADSIDEIEELEDKLKVAKEKLAITIDSIKNQTELLEKSPEPESEKPLTSIIPIPELKSTNEIDKQIQDAGEMNTKADLYERHLQRKKGKAEEEKEYDGYNSEIKSIREKKLKTLTETDTKVNGLEIREDGVYYKNVHADNWSDAQSLRIASELCLAQIDRKTQIEAIFLDRFESFGKKAREDFEKWCEEKDVLALVTIVRDELPKDLDKFFFIESGEVEYHELAEKEN